MKNNLSSLFVFIFFLFSILYSNRTEIAEPQELMNASANTQPFEGQLYADASLVTLAMFNDGEWVYVLIISVLFVIVVMLHLARVKNIKTSLREENKHNQEVIRRDYEIELRQKDDTIRKLEEEKVEMTEIRKIEQLASGVEYVIKKNEVLSKIREEIIFITRAISENNIKDAKKETQKLTNIVVSSIESDEEQVLFQTRFNAIHKYFFTILGEKYPVLTRNDKLLSAYLRMDLSSKEIALLQNISVRGVEVNRYRLRKKMNLERDVNLSEFMKNLSQNDTNIKINS